MARRGRLALPVLLGGVLIALAGCESTNLTPAAAPTARLEDDERRLWARAREEEQSLDHSGFLFRDAECEAYLNGIIARLHPPPLGEDAQFHVKVLVDPRLNAFSMPNGTLYVHSGLLARIDNEAQLATVLAHELTHATHRHALKGFRDLKNKTAFAAAFSAGTAGVGALFGLLGAAASVSGYAQDLEREADAAGFRLMVAAGYDPREAVKVFAVMIEESRRAKEKEPFFFGSHPRLSERLANFRQFVDALPEAQRQGDVNAAAYAAHLPALLLVTAESAQQAGETDLAIAAVERALRINAADTRAKLLLAEIRRKRDADSAEALRLFRELVAAHSDLAEAHRGIGLILFKQGDRAGAAPEFRRYLELSATAPDRAFVQNLLEQCETPP